MYKIFLKKLKIGLALGALIASVGVWAGDPDLRKEFMPEEKHVIALARYRAGFGDEKPVADSSLHLGTVKGKMDELAVTLAGMGLRRFPSLYTLSLCAVRRQGDAALQKAVASMGGDEKIRIIGELRITAIPNNIYEMVHAGPAVFSEEEFRPALIGDLRPGALAFERNRQSDPLESFVVHRSDVEKKTIQTTTTIEKLLYNNPESILTTSVIRARGIECKFSCSRMEMPKTVFGNCGHWGVYPIRRPLPEDVNVFDYVVPSLYVKRAA